MKRILPLLAFLALMVAVSLAQTPPPQQQGRPGGPGGNFAPPPLPGDTMGTERDSLMNVVLKKIAGKENMAAESVFKDIQIFKGRPAGSIPRAMNYGFGRALGAGCFHCHSKDGWDKDQDKKRIARAMFKMVNAINNDYLWKIDSLRQGPPGPDGQPMKPTVNCTMCHRGTIRAGSPPPGVQGGMRPGGQH